MLVSCLAYSLALKMEVICYSEPSVDFHQTTRRYIPEDRALQIILRYAVCPVNYSRQERQLKGQ
jgi:hypothetical protein